MQAMSNNGGGAAPQKQTQVEDLSQYINKKAGEALNLASGYVVDNVLFNQTSTSVVKSDSDPQILITVAFNMPVKIKHFVIRGGSDKAARPKTLKLFKNKTTASFDECENDEPTQTFTLKDSDYTDKTEVKYVKFQAVTSLAIFIEDNHGADTTEFSQLTFFGLCGDDMKVKDIHNQQGDS